MSSCGTIRIKRVVNKQDYFDLFNLPFVTKILIVKNSNVTIRNQDLVSCQIYLKVEQKTFLDEYSRLKGLLGNVLANNYKYSNIVHSISANKELKESYYKKLGIPVPQFIIDKIKEFDSNLRK